MKPNQYTALQLQPTQIKTRDLTIPEEGNFQRVIFVADFSAAANPPAVQMTLDGVTGFGTPKRVTIDAKYMPYDTVFAMGDSIGDYVTVPAGSRVRFPLPAVTGDTYTLYVVQTPTPGPIANPLGYVRLYFDNSVSPDNDAVDLNLDLIEYFYQGSITAGGAATPISVADQTGENGLPLITQWGVYAPNVTSTAASQLNVALTLSGNYANAINPLPVLSLQVPVAVGGGSSATAFSNKTKVIWLPTVVPTPVNEGNVKTFTATPSYATAVAAGFAAPANVTVYLWATKALK